MSRKTILFLLIIVLVAGGIALLVRNQYTRGIAKLKSAPIALPLDQMEALYNGRDTVERDTREELKLVVYSDSTACASCRLSKMYFWNDLLEEMEQYEGRVKAYFIFSPRREKVSSTRLSMRTMRFNHVVYLDTAGVFARSNPNLPDLADMHTFLLGADNRVRLVGNPLENEKVRKLFWKIVKEE